MANKGFSLEQDLTLLLNNPKYSDIEILCGDERKLYGCKAILAARSDVFNSLLYNGMKETYENQIFFPVINSAEMEIILEYVYTGSVKEISLTKDNIIETFYAADYFQLSGLQDFIVKSVKNILEKNYAENDSPELLSKLVEIIPISEDNILLGLFIEAVATIPLNHIEFGRLSIDGLQYLLSFTHGKKENPFVTSEYEVFRYSAILAGKKVSNDTYKILKEQLPTLEQLKCSTKVENKFIINHQKVAAELKPLLKFIDFKRIDNQILNYIIKPLGIIPTKVIRRKKKSKILNLNDIRGTLYFWDNSTCGSKLITEDNRKVVYASNDCNKLQAVRAKMMLDNKGILEWDVIIEKACYAAWIGICTSENFDCETIMLNKIFALCTTGFYKSPNYIEYYCPPFGDGSKITVHLDMNKRTCAFTVNGKRHSEVSGLNNLTSNLYPVVLLSYPGRFRIQPHRKV